MTTTRPFSARRDVTLGEQTVRKSPEHDLGSGLQSARPKVLYVAGTGRSGSTVLAQYLESSLALQHVGELRYLWERGLGENHLCECGEPFAGCDFWRAVLATAFPQGTDRERTEVAALTQLVDRLRHIPRHATSIRSGRPARDTRAFGAVLGPLYQAVTHVSGESVVLDSSKDPSYLFALRATGLLDLRVIHIVRDSRAVAHSWTRAKRRPEIHWTEQLMRQVAPQRSARSWTRINSAFELYARVAEPTIVVRYEDFADDPDGVTARITEELDGFLPRRAVDQPHQGHSFSGNPMRFERAPLRVSRDDAWRQEMAPEDRHKVSLLTWPLLLKYGYRSW